MFVPRLGPLKRAAIAVLWSELRPIPYDELTRLAAERMGHSWNDIDQDPTKEDIREKFLQARGLGTFYTFEPHYCGAMRAWFLHPQRTMLNTDGADFLIPADLSACIEACAEAAMRGPHMLTKVAPSLSRERGKARGLIIERHVSDYFHEKWPDFWIAPENAGHYARPCDHDFKLIVGGRVQKVDVMGPRGDGTFGTPIGGGKRPVDLHILARFEGDSAIRVEGFIRGEELRETISPWTTQPLSRLVVRLNCDKLGLPYGDFRREAIKPRR